MSEKGIYVFQFKSDTRDGEGNWISSAPIYKDRTTMIGEINSDAESYKGKTLTDSGKQRILNEIKTKKGISLNTDIINWDTLEVIPSDIGDKGIHGILTRNGYQRVYTHDGKPTEMFDFGEEDPFKIVNQIIIEKEKFKRPPEGLDYFTPNSFQYEDLCKMLRFQLNHPEQNKFRFLVNEQTGGGKTYIALWEVKYSRATRVIVNTYKPDVINQWETTVKTHRDFVDFYTFTDVKKFMRFIQKDENKDKVAILFVSSYLFKENNNWEKYKCLEGVHFDIRANDEAHFGEWNGEQKEKAGKTMVKINSTVVMDITATPFPNVANNEYDVVASHSLVDCYNKKEELKKKVN